MLDDVLAARGSFEESKRCALACGDPVTIAFAESKLGALDDAEDRPAEALQRHLDAFAAFDAAGNVGGIGFCLSRAGLSSYMLGDFRSALDFSISAFEAFDSLGHGWGSAVAAERVAFAYLGLEQTAMARPWAMRSLRLVAGGERARMGRLFALGAMAAAYVREGHGRQWLPVLRAIVADPDMPAVYAMQIQHELDLGEAAAARAGEVAQLAEPTPAAADLDDIITRLLREQGVAATAV
jgi:hypothetical protein